MNRPLSSQAEAYNAYYKKRTLYWSFNVTGKARSFHGLCRRYGVPLSGLRVLDVGFGAGELLFQFAADCDLCGLEFSEGAIGRVRREALRRGLRIPDLRWWDARSTNLPYPSGSFDLVVMSHILEHVPDDLALLIEARRVLSAPGFVVVMVPSDDPFLGSNTDHVRVYTEGAISGAIEAAGFTIIGTTQDHSVDNIFHRLEASQTLDRVPAVRSRILGGLSFLCTLLMGCERWRIFGAPRNLGVVAMRNVSLFDQHALSTTVKGGIDAVGGGTQGSRCRRTGPC